ncbi:16S rRNA (guanine(527)-N(7))-methyltransferase RsmG [Pseudorhodoferax sp. Leaf274]|uniref:16S rRNA (guanine(527)-N(7))-methyltransferase RsmG n=1 Tax=Pseudorhodoferax sp. Leaf274 TaxID=1736318 RepID=UPI000702B809|nr:16S rRNA (guanine(527)-N(7))-methyltransferase RsmG [Pseudorhodoferax sp. Leaf274]KQP49535.1 16S rRNA (guanine(527)-N(7))-methyltransferase RsmG [Pseudorhodoferax sp. Leaf274]
MKSRLLDAAHALGLALSDQEADALLAYQGLIAKWNKVYNLTAVRDPGQMLTQHLVDCLAAVPPLRRALAEQGGDAPALLDVGAGAGLPGVVFAILHPQLQVHCVDTVAKKAAFVQQVAAELKLPNLRGLHARVESLGQGYDVVSSRAFASLVDFTAWSREALKPGAVWLAMKGKEPHDEIAALPADVQVFHVEHLQVPGLEAERCIVWMRPAAA